MLRRLALGRLIACCLAAFTALPLPAADSDGKLPFWAAVRAREVNMRVGPGEDYRINWVYHRPLLPVKVLRTMENWWLVQDPDGARGWVLSSLMTKKRGAMVIGSDAAEMREDNDPASALKWRLAPGVTGRLGDCKSGWCKVELLDKRSGWVRAERLWGAAEF